jgi:hypothetical protein
MEWAAACSEIDKPFSSHRAVARFRELHWLSYFDLGLTPQALCLHLLRRLSGFSCKAS